MHGCKYKATMFVQVKAKAGNTEIQASKVTLSAYHYKTKIQFILLCCDFIVGQ